MDYYGNKVNMIDFMTALSDQNIDIVRHMCTTVPDIGTQLAIWLAGYMPEYTTKDIFQDVYEQGVLESLKLVVEYIYEPCIRDVESCFVHACVNGHLNMAKWIILFFSNIDAFGENEYEFIYKHNYDRYEMIELLSKYAYPDEVRSVNWSCASGHNYTLSEWYAGYLKTMASNDRDACTYCHDTYVQILQWTTETLPLNIIHFDHDYVYRISLLNRHVNVASWLINKYPGIDIHALDEYVFRELCIKGDVELLSEYLNKHSDVNVHVRNDICFRKASDDYNLKVMQELARHVKYDDVWYRIFESNGYIMSEHDLGDIWDQHHVHENVHVYCNRDLILPKLIPNLSSRIHMHRFVVACRNGDISTISSLIDKISFPASANTSTHDFVLIYSCKNNHLDVIKWLMLNYPKTDIHVRNDLVFQEACKKGYFDVALWLVTNYPDIDIHAENEYAFKHACINKCVEIMMFLENLCNTEHVNVPMLHKPRYFVYDGAGYILSDLYTYDLWDSCIEFADMHIHSQIVVDNEQVITTLSRGFISKCQAVLEHDGIDGVENMVRMYPCSPYYFLRVFCEIGDFANVQWLIKQYPYIDVHQNAAYIFQKLCVGGQLEICQWLLDKYPKINIHPDIDIAFAGACINSHIDIIRWLIQIYPDIDVHINACASFYLSCINNCTRIMRALADMTRNTQIEYHIIEKDECTTYGCVLSATPIHELPTRWTSSFTCNQIYAYTLEHYDVDTIKIYIDDLFNLVLKHCQVDTQSLAQLRPISIPYHATKQFIELCKRNVFVSAQNLALDYPVDVHTKDDLAFRLACKANDVDMVRWLLRRYPNTNINSRNRIAFRRASNKKHIEIMNLLVDLTKDDVVSYNIFEDIGYIKSQVELQEPVWFQHVLYNNVHIYAGKNADMDSIVEAEECLALSMTSL